ncbi:hypothetical protein [Synechococcus sp. O70.2]|jgi:hypothetical protein|uniref:hypothetical protein n=1 Tax=unclassified Synechococcus TaxID=2626047 RepID=UPI0039C19CD6
MEARERSQIIASEWMIDSQNPVHSISRLKQRGTYSDITLWWLVVQLNLMEHNSIPSDPR